MLLGSWKVRSVMYMYIRVPNNSIQNVHTVLVPESQRDWARRRQCSSHYLRVDGVRDLLPSGDLLRREDARRVRVALPIPRNLSRLRDNES